MARWTVTIRDPNTNNTIPDVVLKLFGQEGYARSPIQQISEPAFTIGGAAVLRGNTYGYRFTWQLSALVSETDALNLAAMVARQDRRYSIGLDGFLYLIDEYEYVPPEPGTTHSKDLFTGTIFAANNRRTGFARFKVKLQLNENAIAHSGYQWAIAQNMKLVQVTAIELPIG